MNEGRVLRVKIANIDRGRSYVALWVVLLILLQCKKKPKSKS